MSLPATLSLLASAALNSAPLRSYQPRNEAQQDEEVIQEQEESGPSSKSGTGESSKPKIKQRSASMSRPRSASMTKPFRCLNEGCHKVYKQYNGLKYHQSKGQCDFTVRDAVMIGLSAQEVEDSRRPHVCVGGGGCTKRYRQRNGLKYHYQHSGQHGELGLQMLRDGTHPMPQDMPADALSPTSP